MSFVEQRSQQQEEISLIQSVAVMKNCIRLGVSTIAFRRNLFPNNTFMSKSYAGVSLEVLRPIDRTGEVVNAGALQVLEWLELGCFKCLESGYLDKLMFNILDAHPDDERASILECYTFQVGSSTSSQIMGTNRDPSTAKNRVSILLPRVTKDDVHQATQKLIKTLIMVTSSLSPLPPVRWLSISIAYNDRAPPGYQAPDFVFFNPITGPGFSGEPQITPIGEVHTGHQVFALQLAQQQPRIQAQMSTQVLDNNDDDDGYESDSTEARWTREKLEMLQRAEHVIRKAQRVGVDPYIALQSSGLAESIPNNVLQELLSKLQGDKVIRTYQQQQQQRKAM